MSGHTPGPWEIRPHTIGHEKTRQWIEVNAPLGSGRGEKPICRIPAGFINQMEDARLISAAPDLLAACEAMLDPTVRYHELSLKARNAIAKAKGGAA